MFSKCDFWMKQVSFLGHIMSKDGIVVDPYKLAVVLNWNWPNNIAREVEFAIRLVLGTMPIFRVPYRMTPFELKEQYRCCGARFLVAECLSMGHFSPLYQEEGW